MWHRMNTLGDHSGWPRYSCREQGFRSARLIVCGRLSTGLRPAGRLTSGVRRYSGARRTPVFRGARPHWPALRRVRAGHHDISSPGRRSPGKHAWACLFEFPSLILLKTMMSAAQRGDITLARTTALIVWDRMVRIAPGRGMPAAGIRARAIPDLDQVPEPRGQLVSGGFA